MPAHLTRFIACLALVALFFSGCCSTPATPPATAQTGSPAKPPGPPTPLDLVETPFLLAYYLFNPFLDTSRPTESERFEQAAKQARAARNPRS